MNLLAKKLQRHTLRKEKHQRLVVERRRIDIQQEAVKTFPGFAKQEQEHISEKERQITPCKIHYFEENNFIRQ